MTDTYVLDQVRIHKNEARGYTIRDGDLVNIRRIRQYETPSHFGIFSNVHDLVKWDAALYTDTFLSATSRAEMWTPVRLADGSSHPYGFGWRVWRQRGHAIQRHRGITGTEIVRLPEDTLVIVVLTNLASGPGINNQGIALEIAEMMLPTLRRAPLVETPASEAELRRYVGKYSSGERRAEISIERGRLHLTPPGASRSVELVFQGNLTFEVRPVDRRVVFEAERRGEISGYTVFSRGDVPPVHFVRADRQQ
jgi:CubicO group peptidase (beta-lactamase class C family)